MYLACSKLHVQFNRSINIDMITAIKEKVYIYISVNMYLIYVKCAKIFYGTKDRKRFYFPESSKVFHIRVIVSITYLDALSKFKGFF